MKSKKAEFSLLKVTDTAGKATTHATPRQYVSLQEIT